uniref:Endonuclease-reverse transcriptase n=1 Tax=Arion vulgaris TaxID=1028688 RepID=A0A0B7BUE4_9EUPU
MYTSRLSVFHHSCLRRILGIFWPVKISNNQLLQDTRQEAMNDILKKRRWKWLGHVMRMRQEMPARIALTWTPEGKRKKGRPRTTWRRMMEEELDTASLTWGSALKVARDRRAWKVLSEAPCVTRHDGIK